MNDLIQRLRERALAARKEGTATSLGDALHFEEAANALEGPAQEPVAWQYRWKLDGEWTNWRVSDASQKSPHLKDLEERPLYAAAPTPPAAEAPGQEPVGYGLVEDGKLVYSSRYRTHQEEEQPIYATPPTYADAEATGRMPTREEAAAAASVLLRCNGADLSDWGGDGLHDDNAQDALKDLAAIRSLA
ncbi:hypothetical protein OSH12_26170, partial [Kaistia terrae]